MRYWRRGALLGFLIVATALACTTFGSTIDEPADASASSDATVGRDGFVPDDAIFVPDDAIADGGGDVDDAGSLRGPPAGCEGCALSGLGCCIADGGATCSTPTNCVSDGGFAWGCGVARDCDSGECCGLTSSKPESTRCLAACNGLGGQVTMCEPGGDACRTGTSCGPFAGAPSSLGLLACE